MAVALEDLQLQTQPTKPAGSRQATVGLSRDFGDAAYALAAVLPDGSTARIPCSALSWEEQTGEIATRITATLPDDQIGGTGQRLPDLIRLNTPVTVLAAMGDDSNYIEVARGLVEELAPNDGTGGTFEIIAYDPIKTLLNNKIDKFYEADITPAEVISRLFDDQQIPVGEISPHLSEKPFPGPTIFHGQTVADALTKTVENGLSLLDPDSNVRLVIRTEEGRISIVEVGNNQPVYWLLQGANVNSVRQRLSITDLITKVVITGKATDAGEAAVVTTFTADTAATYGDRTDIIALTENVTPDQVKKLARDDMNQKGQPRNDRSIVAPDIPMIRKFDQIRVTAGALDDHYSVESITHDEASRTMTISLGNLNFTPTTGVFADGLGKEIDESAIPPVQTTGGDNGSLVNIGTGPINDAQLYALAKAAGFTGNDAIMAVAISLAEDPKSDPQARNHNTNSTDDLGLWQINSIHWGNYGGEGAMIVPLNNAKAAYGIWSAAGGSWSPWSTFKVGAQAKYMDRARAAANAPTAEVPTPNAAYTQSGARGTPNSALVTAMNKWVNTPYQLGAATPGKAVDCSGFTQSVMKDVGVNLPRTAQTQWNATQRVSTPQFGDLVFFKGTYDCPDPITHVGIYVGNGEMVSAVEPHVKRDSINSPYWKAHLAGFGRPG